MHSARSSPHHRPAEAGIAFAKRTARIAEENRAEDILILDLRTLSAVADFFIIATGTSDRQMRAIAEQIEQEGKSVGQRPYRVSGYENGTWILLDYIDVVVHLFDPQRRTYYDLELLWGDAPRIDWH